jgi:hypothetical protein
MTHPRFQRHQQFESLSYQALYCLSIIYIAQASNIPECTSLPYARPALVGTTFQRPSPSASFTNRELVVESETTIVPFAPPLGDQVTNGAPWGFSPETEVILRIVSVPAISGDVTILKLTSWLAVEFRLLEEDSKTMMYLLFGS